MTWMVITMWRCRWARHRLQRYVDGDPSAPLTGQEVAAMREHLATCDRCAQIESEYRGLSRALASWSASHSPDPAAVARLRLVAQQLASQDTP